MIVTVNGEERTVVENSTVLDFLENLSIPVQRGLAVAINYQVVPKSEYLTTNLREGDSIEIIRPTSGG